MRKRHIEEDLWHTADRVQATRYALQVMAPEGQNLVAFRVSVGGAVPTGTVRSREALRGRFIEASRWYGFAYLHGLRTTNGP